MDWTKFGANGVIDWNIVESEFPHAAAMKDCIQDPVFHAEGDVWTHTRMVVEALLADPELESLPPERRTALALAALWHDCEKPATRAVEHNGERERITHHGHSLRGAITSWSDLWRAGVPLPIRERVFALILWHQRVFHVFSRADVRAEIAKYSLLGPWRDLVILAKADNRGRSSPNTQAGEQELDLVRMAAEEHGCLERAWPFPTDQARLRFARTGANSLYYEPPPPMGSKVVILSGLPGAGKDTYAAAVFADYPQVSLDALREELDLAPEDNQGAVAQAALARAREYLRARRPFIVNATNLTRDRRRRFVELALSYDADVEIHSFDIPEPAVRSRNRGRKEAVPEKVIDRMIAKWEPPTALEAHRVTWIGPNLEFSAQPQMRQSPDPGISK